MTEAVLSSVIDKTGWPRKRLLLVLSLIGFSVGLLFTTRGGLQWLDFTDGHVSGGTFGIMLVGLAECLVLGWVFDIKKLRRHANRNSDWQLGVWWEWVIRLVIPIILITLVVWSFIDKLNNEDGYMIDKQGQWIITDLLGMSLVIGIFLAALVLGLWQPKEKPENNEGPK